MFYDWNMVISLIIVIYFSDALYMFDGYIFCNYIFSRDIQIYYYIL